MSKIQINKNTLNKQNLSKVIDTQFRQLINSDKIDETPTFTLDDFFILYEQLFFQIPKDGDSNSHQYIIQKEAEYLGINLNNEDIQSLLAEITSLRQEITEAQQTIQNLQK